MKFWITGLIAATLAMALFVLPGGSTASVHADVEDYCGVEGYFDVPDSGPLFNFASACMEHDECYGEGGDEADRNECDAEFLANMLDSCNDMWRNQRFALRACSSVARTYHFFVYAFGGAFFPYGEIHP